MIKIIQLHTHDAQASLLDSILTVNQIAKFAKDNNQNACAITNHGYMSSYVSFVKACKKEGVKPIIGCEVYEVDNVEEKADTKDYRQQRYHLVLLAKNYEGLLNLFKIVSESCTNGFYKKPRTSIKVINENNLGKGIICLTACQVGRLSRLLVNGKESEAHDFVNKLQDTFDDVFCEIQSHNTESQIEANCFIAKFINKYSLPYVVTTDAHMLKGDQLNTHAIFVEIGEGREVGESYVDCFLQTDDDVYRILGNQFSKDFISKGITNTQIIADMIEDIDIGLNKGAIMPVIPLQEGFESNKEYLRYLVYKDFDKKFADFSEEEKQKRRDRIEIELPVLYAVNYTDYFIMLYMLAQEADKRKIPRGYSRGSGGNCECLFLLGVTQIDSVKWDLDFSRFANLGRKSMADFDWDISKRRRKEFVEISEYLFGKENVAPIATFNTLSTKVAIRDIGKVLNEKQDSPYYNQIPYQLRDEVAKLIPTIKTINDLGEEEEKEVLLKDIINKNAKLQSTYETFPLWFKYVMELEGLPKSMGRHAAGTLITPKSVINYCPLCLDSEGNQMVQLEMHSAMDDLGLIKMDYLGLETLDIIDDALKMAGLTWSDVDINTINLSDSKVYDEVYKKGQTIGIFQMESLEARKMCIEAKTDNIEDIIVINAANRPGTKDSFPIYCKNKEHPDQVTVLHPDLLKIFSKTKYVLLYQEQALQLFRYAQFPEPEVDNARRAIGHKEKKTMAELKDKFKKGLTDKGWGSEQINEIWELMQKQSEYCFNRGHSVAYGLLSYLTAYLKVHYPLFYLTACLTAKSNDISKLSIFINECNRLGIKVSPPSVNRSGSTFTAIKEKNQILFGLLAIKGIGESVVDSMINNRPYEGFDDFIAKNQDNGKVNKSTLISLIKSGAIPTKNKREFLTKYANNLFECDYKDEKYVDKLSLPRISELKETWGIDTDNIKNKQERLKLYNELRKKQYDDNRIERLTRKEVARNKYIHEFAEKYMKEEYMWEFETLSMFISHNPLKEAYKYISVTWDDTADGEKATLLCVVIDIQRKKDKHGNVFAYISLYTPYGIIEATCWSAQYKAYTDLIQKGNCLAVLGRKKENQFFVELIKPYMQWIKDKKIKV